MDSITAEDVYVIFVELVNKMVRKCKIMAKHQPECFLLLARVYSPDHFKKVSAAPVLKKPALAPAILCRLAEKWIFLKKLGTLLK